VFPNRNDFDPLISRQDLLHVDALVRSQSARGTFDGPGRSKQKRV
jgi:hypothetical protein